jgi:hypothetical protein
MDSGSALCLYSSRYLIFRENYTEFKGADADAGLRVYFTRKKEHIAYHFFPQKLLSSVPPYHGEAAERFYSVRAVYADAQRSSLLSGSVTAGKDFDINWRYFSKLALEKHWLWDNPKVKAKLSKWLDSEIKKKPVSAEECAPAAELLVDIPNSYLDGYRAETAPNRKLKHISAKYSIVVARAVCAAREEESQSLNRNKLRLDTLLEALKK